MHGKKFSQLPINRFAYALLHQSTGVTYIRLQVQPVRTFLARVANLRVLCVSSAWLEAGVTQATTAMRAPAPARDPCSTRVSLLSLRRRRLTFLSVLYHPAAADDQEAESGLKARLKL